MHHRLGQEDTHGTECRSAGAHLEFQQLYIFGEAALQSLSCKEGIFPILQTLRQCVKITDELHCDIRPCCIAGHLYQEDSASK